MFPTSENFIRRVRESGHRKTVVDILSGGQSNVLVAENIPIQGGSIKADRTASIRRSGSLIIPEKQLVPSFSSTLTPYGVEIKVRHGIVYPDKTEELIPCGVFILDTTSWSEDTGPIPTIEFFDRSMPMERAQVGPVLDYSGALPSAVIASLIEYFWPDLPVDIEVGLDDPINPGGTVYSSGNHWDIVEQQARKMGAEIYFDVIGNPVVRRLPVFNDTTSTNDAVWDCTTGSNGILTKAQRAITREGVYNAIYVLGAAPSYPGAEIPYAFAINQIPSSPTYFDGPFRRMGIKITDNTLTTFVDCQRVANEKLAEVTRLGESLSFESIPNPAVEPGDIAKITYVSGETQVGLVESFTLPLGAGSMSGNISLQKV